MTDLTADDVLDVRLALGQKLGHYVSKREAADLVGVTAGMWSHWEHGINRVGVESAAKILAVLKRFEGVTA